MFIDTAAVHSHEQNMSSSNNSNAILILGLRSSDGSPFFQGDIVLDASTRAFMQKSVNEGVRKKRAVKKFQNARWPNGVIPFVISKNLGKHILFCMLQFKNENQNTFLDNIHL